MSKPTSPIKAMPQLECVISIEISKHWNIYGEHGDAMRNPHGNLWQFVLSVQRSVDIEVRKQLRQQLAAIGVDGERLRMATPAEGGGS